MSLRLLRIACLLLVTGAQTLAAATETADPAPLTPAPMVGRVLPSAVSIAVTGTTQFDMTPLQADPIFRQFFEDLGPLAQSQIPFQAAGSGVIFCASKGLALTNAHVVANAGQITVRLMDATETDAMVVGVDPETDLAALRIAPEGWVEITIGQSSKLQVAGYVLAIVTAFGLEQTVTLGIVSALGRRGMGVDGCENLIQTDASINPGNSGSALVAQVMPASAADAAGLRPRDVILALDGVAIPDAATLLHQIGLRPPEQRVKLDSARDDKPMTVAAVPGQADQQVRSSSPGGRSLCSLWPFRGCQPSVHRTQDE